MSSEMPSLVKHCICGNGGLVQSQFARKTDTTQDGRHSRFGAQTPDRGSILRTYVRMYIRMGMSASIRIRMRRPLFLIDTGDGLRPKTRSDGNQIVTASKAARERVALGNRQSEDFSSSHAGAATAAPNIDAKMAAVGANPPAVPGASRTKQTPAGFPERNYPNKARHLKALTATAVRLAAAEVASTPRGQMENVTSRNK
jgi:hypothetical protein